MQYGIVKLNSLVVNHHLAIPIPTTGFTKFAEECEKNIKAQDKIWQHTFQERANM